MSRPPDGAGAVPPGSARDPPAPETARLGPFAGVLASVPGGASEAVRPRLAELLALGEGAPEARPLGPGLVPIRGAIALEGAGEGTLRYEGDLAGLTPLEGRAPPAERWAQLAAVLSALAPLHASGRAHGDLRPAHVWVGTDLPTGTVRVSHPAKPVDASLLLRTRLREEADLADVGFVAPEILAGKAATPASDVFAVAAILYASVHGRPPHGWPRPLASLGVPPALEVLLVAALGSDPAGRPAPEDLRRALDAAASGASDAAVVADVPAPRGVAPKAARVAGAGGVGDARVVPLARPIGVGFAPEGGARGAEPGAKEKQEGLSAILVLLLFVGGAFVLFGAIWLVVLLGAVLGTAGFLLCSLVATGAVGFTGYKLETRGYARSGFALVALASQLLWADGGLVIALLDGKAPTWTLIGAAITAVTTGLAIARTSTFLALLGAVGGAIATVALGDALSTGSRTGPAVWTAVCAGALAGLAVVGHRGAGPRVGLPYAAVAWIFALVSAPVGLATDTWGRDYQAFATAWPYVILAGAAGATWLLAPGAYRGLALALVVILVAFTPSVEALVYTKQLPYFYWAVACGTGVVVLAFKWPALDADVSRQLLAVLAGLPGAAGLSGLLAIANLGGRDADALVREAFAQSAPERLGNPLLYFTAFLGISAVLVALGLLFARDAERKTPYRVIEGAGLLLFFGTLTILSLSAYRVYLYPAVLFLGGLGLVALGVWLQHLLLVAVSSVFLLLNTWIQYFARLWDEFPGGLLLLVFGIGLLVGGFFFEKSIRPKLGLLRGWR